MAKKNASIGTEIVIEEKSVHMLGDSGFEEVMLPSKTMAAVDYQWNDPQDVIRKIVGDNLNQVIRHNRQGKASQVIHLIPDNWRENFRMNDPVNWDRSFLELQGRENRQLGDIYPSVMLFVSADAKVSNYVQFQLQRLRCLNGLRHTVYNERLLLNTNALQRSNIKVERDQLALPAITQHFERTMELETIEAEIVDLPLMKSKKANKALDELYDIFNRNIITHKSGKHGETVRKPLEEPDHYRAKKFDNIIRLPNWYIENLANQIDIARNHDWRNDVFTELDVANMVSNAYNFDDKNRRVVSIETQQHNINDTLIDFLHTKGN